MLIFCFVVFLFAFDYQCQKSLAADPAIPFEYGKPLLFRFKGKEEVFVFHGVADPVYSYSRSHFVVLKFDSLPDLLNKIKAQRETAGPFAPNEIIRSNCLNILVESFPRTDAAFKAFGHDYEWTPGNFKMGWIVSMQSKLEIAKLPLIEQTNASAIHFRDSIEYSKSESDRVIKESTIELLGVDQ